MRVSPVSFSENRGRICYVSRRGEMAQNLGRVYVRPKMWVAEVRVHGGARCRFIKSRRPITAFRAFSAKMKNEIELREVRACAGVFERIRAPLDSSPVEF